MCKQQAQRMYFITWRCLSELRNELTNLHVNKFLLYEQTCK